jgi:hypothetical protein
MTTSPEAVLNISEGCSVCVGVGGVVGAGVGGAAVGGANGAAVGSCAAHAYSNESIRIVITVLTALFRIID